MAEAKSWREIPQRYRLEAKQCANAKCGKIFFPPRLKCSECGHQKFKNVQLPDQGHIVTYTVIHTPPAQFVDESPYAVAIIELTNGVRLTAQVADCEESELKTGLKVRLTFRKIQQVGEHGIKMYGYKAVLED